MSKTWKLLKTVKFTKYNARLKRRATAKVDFEVLVRRNDTQRRVSNGS